MVSLPPGGFVLTATQTTPVAVRLRRFGGDFGPYSVALPAIAGRASVVVPIHPDSAGVPWRAQLSGSRSRSGCARSPERLDQIRSATRADCRR